MIKGNKKLLSKILVVLLSCGLIQTGMPIQVRAATSMGLTASSMGTNNSMNLVWNNLGSGYSYMVYSKGTNEASFQSIPTKSDINVLNVYPDVGGSLKTWMEDDGYGQGHIHVTEVTMSNFNSNPLAYLKSNGQWKYDVIMFGSWDCNNNQDLNSNSASAVESFILSGRGVLFGHDTLTKTYFDTLKKYMNFSGSSSTLYDGQNAVSNCAQSGNSTITVTHEGLLTNYPWKIGNNGTNLSVPKTHTDQLNTYGDIWMKFNYQQAGFNDPSNYYLTTWNNTASIMTGHSMGQATPDEEKLLANTLFYLAQTTDATQIADHKSQDFAAPNAPTIKGVSENQGILNVSYNVPTDNGTPYQYYVKATNGSTTVQSDTISAVNTTGVIGYSYVVDNNPTTEPDNTVDTDKATFNFDLTKVDTTKPIYIHVKAIDAAGNGSTTLHYTYNHQGPASVKSAIDVLISNFKASNTTTEGDILTYIKNNIQLTSCDISFSSSPAFSRINTSYDSAGSVTGVINITDGITSATSSVNLVIPKLVLNTIDTDNATKAVAKAESTFSQSDVDAAQLLVQALPECSIKTDLLSRLDNVRNVIANINNATSAVIRAEGDFSQTNVDYAQSLIDLLPASTSKTDLQNRLNLVQSAINNLLNATNAVIKAEGSKNQTDISTAQSLINLLPIGLDRTTLQNRLNMVVSGNNNLLNATNAVSKAEVSKTQTDVDKAQSLIDILGDGTEKTNLQNRLNVVQAYISNLTSVSNAVSKAESTKSQIDVNNAQSLIDLLPASSDKMTLQNRLNVVKTYITNVANTTTAVTKAESTKSATDVANAQTLINNLPNGEDKTKLQTRLDAVSAYLSNVTNATNAVVKAESSKTPTDINAARILVDALPDGTTKTSLANRLTALEVDLGKGSKASYEVIKAIQSGTQSSIDDALDLINQMPDGAEKTNLLNQIKALQLAITNLNNATKAVEKAEASYLQLDVTNAQSLIDKLASGTDKTGLQTRLDVIKTYNTNKTSATNAVIKAETSYSSTDVTNAQALINKMPAGADRTDLQTRLDVIKTYNNNLSNATNAVSKAEGSLLLTDYTTAKNLVSLLPDGSVKTTLENKLDTVKSKISVNSDVTNAVIKAENSKNPQDIAYAQSLINGLTDATLKSELNDRLNAVQSGITNLTTVTNLVTKAEQSLSQDDVNNALALMNSLSINNSNLKSRLSAVQTLIDSIDLATKAVEKAEKTKLQEDKNYAAPLVKALDDKVFATKKANLQSRLDAVQDYINQMNDSTYGVVKAGITKTGEDATNAQTPISELPSSSSENNLQDKTNVPSTGTTDKEVLQDGLNNTTNYLNAVTVATNAVVKAEGSLSQSDVDAALVLVNNLTIKNSNLTTRLSVVQKQIDIISNATTLVETAESTHLQTDVNKAKTAVGLIKNATIKADLLSRLDNVQTYIKNLSAATYAVTRVETTKLKTDFTKAQTLVSALDGGSDKTSLQNRLDAVKSKLK